MIEAVGRQGTLGPVAGRTQGLVLVSLGYEGRSISAFLGACESAGLASVVDVRLTPWSRKKGFSKTMLEIALRMRGIRYVHEPSLGNPKDNRESFRAGDDAARSRFEASLTQMGKEALGRIRELGAMGPVGILCYERDESTCHRQLVINAVTAEVPTTRVISIP